MSTDSLVSIFMSTLQCVQVVGITCVTVCPPWRILRPGLVYFALSVNLKTGKIVQIVLLHDKGMTQKKEHPEGDKEGSLNYFCIVNK